MRALIEMAEPAAEIVKTINAYKQILDEQSINKKELLVSIDIQSLLDKLVILRKDLCQNLVSFPSVEMQNLAAISDIYAAIEQLRNCLFDEAPSVEEKKIIKSMMKIVSSDFRGREAYRAYVVLSLYFPSYDLPIPSQWRALPVWSRLRFLQLALRQPHLMRKRDEKKYLDYYCRLSAWLLVFLDNKAICLKEKKEAIAVIQEKMGYGACYYVDQSVLKVIRYRARLIQAVARIKRIDQFIKENGFKKKRKEGKLRLGILSRNRGDYTDTRALYALFNSFNQKYEIYWYSLGVKDKSTLYNPKFEKELSDITHKYVELPSTAKAIASIVLSDDLDIFVLGTAYSTGIKEIDLAISGKLGRKQVSLVSLFPGCTCLPSFDYTIIPKIKETHKNTIKTEGEGGLIEIDGPLLWYQKKEKVKPSSLINRSALGIKQDQIVYMSGGAVNKQMSATLRTWLDVIRVVPNSVLVLFPFNPAWGGYYIALPFFARLRSVLRDYPDIHPERIKIIKQVSPMEGDQLLQLADVYFGSFPRDGGTMAMLSLLYGIPLVARRERWLHGLHDAQLLRSLCLEELIGIDNGDVTKKAIHLGTNRSCRLKIKERIEKAINKAPFFDHINRSFRLQKTFDNM